MDDEIVNGRRGITPGTALPPSKFFNMSKKYKIIDMPNYIERLPTCEEYNKLRESAGWGALDASVVKRSLPKTIYSICAEHNGDLIGFGRVVGDGGLCFYIQEIIVSPDHQRKGIGTYFLDRIMEYIGRNATKRSYIAVMVGKGLENFYSKYGFWSRPTTKMGPGMMMFWNDPEFNIYYSKTEQIASGNSQG
ncbi:MAG: GNAT family N-acetyltransferase [Desulfobacteraceae bacterium]|jgi:GNAT superfamily N-acetyltransferase